MFRKNERHRIWKMRIYKKRNKRKNKNRSMNEISKRNNYKPILRWSPKKTFDSITSTIINWPADNIGCKLENPHNVCKYIMLWKVSTDYYMCNTFISILFSRLERNYCYLHSCIREDGGGGRGSDQECYQLIKNFKQPRTTEKIISIKKHTQNP